MIRIDLVRGTDGWCGYTVQGHAGLDDYGKDILCAAVSALTIATANGLSAQGIALAECSAEADRICLRLADDLSPDAQVKAQAILETYVLAVEALNEDYDDAFIQIHRTNR
ncbi:ribosomal-processing cysteine protease Prp [Peptococcus simiae]|uniref:ribosomal-processing cysteine protease Prp n=1 Tax=Peptococcus simiae TaxID=1643805 RepID=UPI0039806B58